MTPSPCVVDTSAWIEWLDGGEIGKRIAPSFPPRELCIVPTIVQLELAKWLGREVSVERAERVMALTMKCVVVPLDTELAVLAAEVHREHRLATADAIVYATARRFHARLLTCDAHFEDLVDVAFVAKSA